MLKSNAEKIKSYSRNKPFVFDGQVDRLTPEVMEKLRWQEEKIKDLPFCYLVYIWRDEIRVRKGKVWGGFHPTDDNGRPAGHWLSKIPYEYMKINSYGKVLCRHKKDIPQAVEMVRKHRQDKREAVIIRNQVAVSNIDAIAGQQGYTILTEKG